MTGAKHQLPVTNYQLPKGFTLVETLVVLAIFSTAMVVAADLFLRINDTSRRVEFGNRIQMQLRETLERMTREVKFGEIDYDGYGGTIPAGPLTALKTISDDGTKTEFAYGPSAVCPTSSPKCVRIIKNGAEANFTPDHINVTNVAFYITPSQNPFVRNAQGNFLADEEPRVTIVLQYTGAGSSQDVRLSVQTTVSSRLYAR